MLTVCVWFLYRLGYVKKGTTIVKPPLHFDGECGHFSVLGMKHTFFVSCHVILSSDIFECKCDRFWFDVSL